MVEWAVLGSVPRLGVAESSGEEDLVDSGTLGGSDDSAPSSPCRKRVRYR
jgi:hypothetical protein